MEPLELWTQKWMELQNQDLLRQKRHHKDFDKEVGDLLIDIEEEKGEEREGKCIEIHCLVS